MSEPSIRKDTSNQTLMFPKNQATGKTIDEIGAQNKRIGQAYLDSMRRLAQEREEGKITQEEVQREFERQTERMYRAGDIAMGMAKRRREALKRELKELQAEREKFNHGTPRTRVERVYRKTIVSRIKSIRDELNKSLND